MKEWVWTWGGDFLIRKKKHKNLTSMELPLLMYLEPSKVIISPSFLHVQTAEGQALTVHDIDVLDKNSTEVSFGMSITCRML